MENYTLDPTRISLERFNELTISKRLIPSRIILHEQINERFQFLKNAGISNLGELIKILGSKQKIAAFASSSGVPAEYLVLLKREAGSYLARPFPLSDFPGIPHEYVEALKAKEIRHTREFFERAQTDDQRHKLSGLTGIPEARLMEIFSLTDLSRITGIGAVFARIVFESGIRSVRQFANTDASTHCKKYLDISEKHGYAAGHFVEEDIQYCIDYARVIIEKA
ncbi:MAG: DUF4332 domain-containing protein [Bacteroidales bacterium]|nr:DUF4332 domain-containing protein [Bacteroidales bacterium]